MSLNRKRSVLNMKKKDRSTAYKPKLSAADAAADAAEVAGAAVVFVGMIAAYADACVVLPDLPTRQEREQHQRQKWATSKLSQERLADLQEAFAVFDKDGSGDIGTEELGTVMRTLGMNPSDQEVQRMVREVDLDGESVITMHIIQCINMYVVVCMYIRVK